ncbi:Glutathione synthetase [Eumeta japonica]|uniref:Glutathione synthetase n=1 Tax=Eumeta variegata TaxID=151549 RepID=A0A4C1WWM2_EUMVA|nr:Glutathione synthetase [Eumeta japonica]
MASHRRIKDGEISRLLLETSDEETLEFDSEIEDTLLQNDVQSDGEDCEVSTISQSPNTENDPGALPSESLPPDVPNYVIVPQHQSSRLTPCISLPLENKVLINIIEKAKDWALMHGVGMRDKKNFNKDAIQFAPFVLLPSPFPRAEFHKAVELQPVLNELMHKVAHSDDFLEQTLQNALQVDEFTASLYNIWVKVREEGISQGVKPMSVPEIIDKVSIAREICNNCTRSGVCLPFREVGLIKLTFGLADIVRYAEIGCNVGVKMPSLSWGKVRQSSPILLLEASRDQQHRIWVRASRTDLQEYTEIRIGGCFVVKNVAFEPGGIRFDPHHKQCLSDLSQITPLTLCLEEHVNPSLQLLKEYCHRIDDDSYYSPQLVRNQCGELKSVGLGLFRSDYLLQATSNRIKQVELNTIAASFGAVTSMLPDMTRYGREAASGGVGMVEGLGMSKMWQIIYILRQLGQADKLENMPENRALSGLCLGIIEAYELFGNPEAVVLFVVEEVSYNICDQRFHEFEISERRPDILILRKTLNEIYVETALNDKKQLMVIDTLELFSVTSEGRPVAVVYYRSGYEPAQYPSAREWEARLRVERSTAIKCPSIQYQLAGTKKVQQALAAPGALEKLMGPSSSVARVRDIFTGLYSLDFDESGEKAVEMAIEDAERFVLKPQREGGGNNVYGADVREVLLRMRHSRERAAYILMERILPPLVAGYVVRPGAPVPPPMVDLVCELGIFGVIIGTKDKIYSNKQVGHMLRTKTADANEGGVAAGLGALDSPYLVDL